MNPDCSCCGGVRFCRVTEPNISPAVVSVRWYWICPECDCYAETSEDVRA